MMLIKSLKMIFLLNKSILKWYNKKITLLFYYIIFISKFINALVV